LYSLVLASYSLYKGTNSSTIYVYVVGKSAKNLVNIVFVNAVKNYYTNKVNNVAKAT